MGWGPGGDADARALATRMKSVGHSIDAVAKALSADTPSAAELSVGPQWAPEPPSDGDLTPR